MKLEAVGHGVGAAFAPALSLAQSFDLARSAEGMMHCIRLVDTALLVDLAAPDPLSWCFPIELGLDRLNGATGPGCLGEIVDQDFARGVLIPTYLVAIAAGQPVVHRILAVANQVLLSYRRLTVPLGVTMRGGRASHLLLLAQVDFALPQACARDEAGVELTLRERRCLSLAASGRGAKQMAAALGVSAKTVELHLARARHKLGARPTTQAVAAALALALVEKLAD